VPIAVEVANALNADLEVIVVRKLALPLNPEGGLGAVADDGTSILNEDRIRGRKNQGQCKTAQPEIYGR
jgi:putative phosphoribosyl transferase